MAWTDEKPECSISVVQEMRRICGGWCYPWIGQITVTQGRMLSGLRFDTEPCDSRAAAWKAAVDLAELTLATWMPEVSARLDKAAGIE